MAGGEKNADTLALSMRLIHATTSCDEGLAGLSRLMAPYARYSFNGRRNGVCPAGMGV